MKKYTFVIVFILLLDQALKFYIKTTFVISQQHKIANWLYLNFIENNGMAFGLEFGGEFGKLALSLFRLVFIAAMGVYLFRHVIPSGNKHFAISLSLIFAGAVGNLIDSMFYGMLFSSSEFQIAEFLPEDGGYASFMHGRVVDMFYVPLVQGHYPEWVPHFGGREFIFFRPVFNIADSAITIGIIFMILFQSKVFAAPPTVALPNTSIENTTSQSNSA